MYGVPPFGLPRHTSHQGVQVWECASLANGNFHLDKQRTGRLDYLAYSSLTRGGKAQLLLGMPKLRPSGCSIRPHPVLETELVRRLRIVFLQGNQFRIYEPLLFSRVNHSSRRLHGFALGQVTEVTDNHVIITTNGQVPAQCAAVILVGRVKGCRRP